MNLYCGEQCAFASFSNQLGALKVDDSQRLATACEAERWAPKQKECTPAPSPRAYKEYARRFVTIHVDEFRTSYIQYGLGCPLQRDEMEKCHRRSEDIEKYGPLTEERMERRAKVRGLVAFLSRNRGEKGVECANRDFNAAMYIRRCAVPEKRPEQLTRAIIVWQPLKIEVYSEHLKPIEGSGRERRVRVCGCGLIYRI